MSSSPRLQRDRRAARDRLRAWTSLTILVFAFLGCALALMQVFRDVGTFVAVQKVRAKDGAEHLYVRLPGAPGENRPGRGGAPISAPR